MNDFKIELTNRITEIERILAGFEPAEEGHQRLIFEAMNYSVNAGGKRLRPMLLLESFRLFSKNEAAAYPFMAAMEMIHTYSLVHDDLPAMDNDLYRRGKKTTHAVYGEDMGILAGDALLNYAYEIMSQAVVKSEQVEQSANAMAYIAKKAGVYGMVGGQTVDVLNEDKEMSLDMIRFIHKLKTAALIEASMVAGGMLAGATQEDLDDLEKIAENVGMAFQIQDDILDVTSTTEVLGKPVGSDDKNHKSTFVTLVGLEKSKEYVQNYSDEAVFLLEKIGEKNQTDITFLKTLILSLIHREK
ncbi:MAG: polyprenyl synthetase family protein [Eubacterium sp.]|nr:polyprenyl synthetase family protein [Eubacterium sp.]